MEAKVRINELEIDHNILNRIDKDKIFDLTVFKIDDEIGLLIKPWYSSREPDMITIMLNKETATYLAKSMLNIADTLP